MYLLRILRDKQCEIKRKKWHALGILKYHLQINLGSSRTKNRSDLPKKKKRITVWGEAGDGFRPRGALYVINIPK